MRFCMARVWHTRRMDEPRWDDLRVFLAVFRAESFSAGAKALGVESDLVCAIRCRAHHSSGQGSTIFQRSPPFLIFFISGVSPPLRRIQSFTVSG